jgi:hypothetical protein
MQGRLVNEMAEAKVTTMQQANKHLKKWVDWYNHCHVHSITKQIPNERYIRDDAFKSISRSIDLEQVFCLKYERTVKSDNTFQHEGITYQLKPNDYRISYAKAKVEIRIYLSKKLKVFYKNQQIGEFNYKLNKIKDLKTWGDILALH